MFPSPKESLATEAFAAVITLTIGAVADPVPPLIIGSIFTTSSVKSTLAVLEE